MGWVWNVFNYLSSSNIPFYLFKTKLNFLYHFFHYRSDKTNFSAYFWMISLNNFFSPSFGCLILYLNPTQTWRVRSTKQINILVLFFLDWGFFSSFRNIKVILKTWNCIGSLVNSVHFFNVYTHYNMYFWLSIKKNMHVVSDFRLRFQIYKKKIM